MEGKSSIICINSNSYWKLCLGRQTLLHVMGPRTRCSWQSWGRRTWPPVKMTQRHRSYLVPLKVQGWRKDSNTARNLQPLHLSLFQSKISHNSPQLCWVKVLSLWCVREGGVWSCWLRVTGWGGHLIEILSVVSLEPGGERQPKVTPGVRV